MNRKTQSIFVIAVIIVAVAAAAYYMQTTQVQIPTTTTAETTAQTQEIPYNQTIVMDGTQGEPSGLDIAWSTDEPSWEIQQGNLYQNLVFYKGESTTDFEGILATGWTLSPDATTYTFTLRQGIHFSNGEPFNAYDIWFNYYRITLNNGPPGYLLGPVIFSPGKVTLDDLNTFNFANPTPEQLAKMQDANQSIQVIDQYTIAFHLPGPSSSFIARLASPPGGIEDPTFVQQHGGVKCCGTANDYVEAHSAPGTGPYMLQSWSRGQRIVLTLNPYYWGPKPHIGTVVIQFKTNIVDALNDLKSGAAQMMYTIPFNLLPDIQDAPGVFLESRGLSYDIVYFSMDTRVYPLNITEVRQAINHAINRQAIIDHIIYGYGQTFQGPLPRGMFAYDDTIQPTSYDVNLAKQLLAQAGFPDGKGIKAFTFLYWTGDPVIQAVVQSIQSDLAQIGITINLQGVTNTAYFPIAATLPRVSNYPDMIMAFWLPDYAYPDDYAYSLLNVNSVFDTPNYNDTDINNWTVTAMNTPDTALQQQLYSKITLREQELAGNVWLYQQKVGPGVPAYLTTVQNVTWNPIQYGFKYGVIYIGPASTSLDLSNLWLSGTVQVTSPKIARRL